MNRIKFIIAVLLISSISYAQQKKYVSYTVKKGETIKAIARDYNMSTRDLLRLNPDVGRKPKANTVIIVPNKNYGKKVVEVKPVKVPKGVHVVKPKETEYGISKHYGVTINALKKANNGLVEGLKPGMYLIIPKVEQNAVDTLKYQVHKVEKGDTVYNLTKRYSVTEEQLLALNPMLSEGLKPEMYLTIPKVQHTIIDSLKYQVHKVEKDDTVYNLTKHYSVTEEQLLALNPTLSEGLKLGMYLTVPKVQQSVDTLKYQVHKVEKDDTVYNLTKHYSVTGEQLLALNPALIEGLKLGMILRIKPLEQFGIIGDSVASNLPKLFVENIDTSKAINVVLMLPYQLNKTSNNSFKESNSLVNIATDFHLGAQIAIDSLKSRGVNVHLDYFDTQNSTQKLQTIVSTNNFDNVDVVIGPLFYKNALWVAKNLKTPVIAPMYSSNQATLKNSNLIKSVPDLERLDEHLISYLKENYRGENIIVINDGKKDSQTRLWRTVNAIKEFDSIQTISVVKPLPKKGKKQNLVINNAKLIQKFSNNSNNWVILISDENETTASAINSLKRFNSNTHTLQLFAFNKGRNFDKVDNILLGNLNFTYPSADFLNMENAAVRSFYKKYQNKNYSVPTKYALKGFDITYDTVIRLASSENLVEGLKAGESRRLTSMFRFDKKLLGGFENNGVHLIQYNKELSPLVIE